MTLNINAINGSFPRLSLPAAIHFIIVKFDNPLSEAGIVLGSRQFGQDFLKELQFSGQKFRNG